MLPSPKRSTVATIAKSPPLRNIRKSKAEAPVKKLNVEKAIANISLSPTTDDSTHESKNKDTTFVDLVDTLDDPPPNTPLSSNKIDQLLGRISSSYHLTFKNPATPFTQLPSTRSRSLLVTHNPNDPNQWTGPQAHKNPNGTQTHITLRKIALTRTPKTDRNLPSSKRRGLW